MNTTTEYTIDSNLTAILTRGWQSAAKSARENGAELPLETYLAEQGYTLEHGWAKGRIGQAGGKVHSMLARFVVDSFGERFVWSVSPACGSQRFGSARGVLPHTAEITCTKCRPALKDKPAECAHCGWDSHTTADCPEAPAAQAAESFDEFDARVETDLLKRAEIKVGDLVRSWDFEPAPGRRDRYVDGIVKSINDDGTLSVHVTADTAFPLGNRFEIRTPLHLYICEFPGRISILKTRAELEAADEADDELDNWPRVQQFGER